jgi:predicted outer membrane protein
MSMWRLLIAASVLGTLFAGTIPTGWAQGQAVFGGPAQTRPIEPEEFLRLAYSSATLQGQAAKLAAGRETRPEVKGYATTAAEFRLGLLQRIEAFAKEHGMPLPSVKEFEHKVIIENLEPLDYLALSRRYAEIQVQAIGQEIGIYQAATRSPSAEIKTFAEQVLPELQRQQEGAQKMYEAVRP